MPKIIILTESHLKKIINNIVSEQISQVPKQIDEQGGLMNLFSKFQFPRFPTNAF